MFPADRRIDFTDPLGKGRMCAEPLDERHESAASHRFTLANKFLAGSLRDA
jgi:hypothetical protein